MKEMIKIREWMTERKNERKKKESDKNKLVKINFSKFWLRVHTDVIPQMASLNIIVS